MRRMILSAFAIGLVVTASTAGVTPRLGERPQQPLVESNGFRAASGAGFFSTVPVTLPVDGQWYKSGAAASTIGPDALGGWMTIPSQSELWSVTSAKYVAFRITDAWLSGDRFEVYVDGVLQLTTNAVSEGASPIIDPPAVSSPTAFETQGKLWAAFADTRYSHGEILLAPGSYTINVKDISFPSGASDAGFAVMADDHDRAESLPKAVPAERSGSWGEVKGLFR